jgi:chlorobactene glucosyltransferase
MINTIESFCEKSITDSYRVVNVDIREEHQGKKRMIEIYLILSTFICLYFLFLSLKNIQTLKKWSLPPEKKYQPMVSIIIPARNEESNIGKCLESLIHQEYKNYEVLVIDDNSTDTTWEILKYYQKRSDKIKIYPGMPLLEGWNGKQYACHQLSKRARGDYLVFTDADTIHSPVSIQWIVNNMRQHHADFMSAYLYHQIGSPGEALVVPAMYLMTTLLMPLWMIPEKNNPFFSFGIGQLLVCKRKAFHEIGGYTQFKDSVVEDMSMARLMKAHGFRGIFLDAKEYIRCRMYSSFVSACKGFIKNVYGAVNQNLLTLCGLFSLIACIIEFPFIHFLDTLLNGNGNLILAGLPVFVFFITWHRVITNRRLNPLISLLYPILFVNILIIAILSFLKTGIGRGAEWKGRLVRCATKQTTGDKDQ